MTQRGDEKAFDFLRLNERDEQRPRGVGLTEIRGPYYSSYGPQFLKDMFDVIGDYVDSFKFPGAILPIMPRKTLDSFIAICHDKSVEVSTGGLIEFVLPQGPEAVNHYFREAADLGFDIVEISTGMLSVPLTDYLRMVEAVKSVGLKVKAEIGIQFGAGGTSSVADLEAEGTADVEWAVDRAQRALESGADMIMLESEGITEQVRNWRTEVPGVFARSLGLDRVMFEAADPDVFGWYVKNYGPEVNLFVDHSQISQLECLRRGIWGTKDLFGRVVTYKGSA